MVIWAARAVGMTVQSLSSSIRTSSSVASASISGTRKCGFSFSTSARSALASVMSMTWARWATWLAGASA